MSEEIYKPRNESESNGLELAKFAIDNAQKFNDKTIALFLGIGSILTIIVVAVLSFGYFNVDKEKDRIERSLISLDEKFAKLEVELKGSSVPDSKLEIVSSSDLMPLNKRSIGGVIFRDENIPGRPWRMAIQYGIKSVGKNASGPIWVKLYFENEGLFSGSSSSDEPGFMSQVILPATSWNNDFAGTYGNVPGSGFYVPVNSNITVVANEIKPMKMRMLIKVYYGLQETKLEKQEAVLEIPSAWVRPSADA